LQDDGRRPAVGGAVVFEGFEGLSAVDGAIVVESLHGAGGKVDADSVVAGDRASVDHRGLRQGFRVAIFFHDFSVVRDPADDDAVLIAGNLTGIDDFRSIAGIHPGMAFGFMAADDGAIVCQFECRSGGDAVGVPLNDAADLIENHRIVSGIHATC